MSDYMIFDKHSVQYMDDNGHEREILIIFEFGPDEAVDLGSDEFLTRKAGRVSFELEGHEYASTATGEGPVQLAYRLMMLSGAQLLHTAQILGLDLYQHEPGDAREPLDFFK